MGIVTVVAVNLAAIDPKQTIRIDKRVLEEKGIPYRDNESGAEYNRVRIKRGALSGTDNKNTARWRQGRCPWEHILFENLPVRMKEEIWRQSGKIVRGLSEEAARLKAKSNATPIEERSVKSL